MPVGDFIPILIIFAVGDWAQNTSVYMHRYWSIFFKILFVLMDYLQKKSAAKDRSIEKEKGWKF